MLLAFRKSASNFHDSELNSSDFNDISNAYGVSLNVIISFVVSNYNVRVGIEGAGLIGTFLTINILAGFFWNSQNELYIMTGVLS